MCQRKKMQIRFNKRRRSNGTTLLERDKFFAFDKEKKVVKYIMQNRKTAGQLTLEAGLPITILKGDQIIRREPSGEETVIASVLKKDGFISVSQVDYILK